MTVRVIFCGTPEAAAVPLRALVEAGHRVVRVVTAPPRPRGRERVPSPSPVARVAEELGLPVRTPERLRAPEVLADLREASPQVLVVFAYGRILPDPWLSLCPTVNLHPSLLPRYRGPAPVPRCLMAGDTETGMTLLRITREVDAGPILAQERVSVGEDETAGELLMRLAVLGARMLLEHLVREERGEVAERPQDEAEATFAPALTPADEWIRWEDSSRLVHGRVRALHPEPGACTFLRGERLKVWRTRLVPGPGGGPEPPGTVLGLRDGCIHVRTGDGAIGLVEVQPSGGRRMDAAAFWRGRPHLAGARLTGGPGE